MATLLEKKIVSDEHKQHAKQKLYCENCQKNIADKRHFQSNKHKSKSQISSAAPTFMAAQY